MKFIIVDEKGDHYQVDNWEKFLKQAPTKQVESIYYFTRLDLRVNKGIDELCEAGILIDEGNVKYPVRNIQYTLNRIKESEKISKDRLRELDSHILKTLKAAASQNLDEACKTTKKEKKKKQTK